MNEKKENVIVNGFFWRFAERCGVQLISAVVSILLARILTPDDYGKVALVTVFNNIMYVLLDCGIGTALVQKKEVLAFVQARPMDGGAGALVVLLQPGKRRVAAP